MTVFSEIKGLGKRFWLKKSQLESCRTSSTLENIIKKKIQVSTSLSPYLRNRVVGFLLFFFFFNYLIIYSHICIHDLKRHINLNFLQCVVSVEVKAHWKKIVLSITPSVQSLEFRNASLISDDAKVRWDRQIPSKGGKHLFIYLDRCWI